MRRLLSVSFVLILVGATRAAGIADEPRALIERGIKAVGGAEAVKQRRAVRMKMKSQFYDSANSAEGGRMDGEIIEFGRRSRCKMLFVSKAIDRQFQATLVINDNDVWIEIDNQVQDISKSDRAFLSISKHVDRVTGLTALLSDKDFTFGPLPEIKLDGRPARGIKVSCKGQPDVSLYFDRESGLLLKYAYRVKKTGATIEELHETVLSDYREPDLASADEKVLRAAKLDVSGPALLAFLRKQTSNPASLERARALVRRLGDNDFKVRERASADLVEVGAAALPLLRAAAKDHDREIARRARDCLQQIGEESSKARVGAAIRLLGLRRPSSTAETLLDYLPDAEDDVAAEVRAVLFAIAHEGGPPDPALVRALDDKEPKRRAAAAAALEKDGGAYAQQPGRRLFAAGTKRAMKQKSWLDGKPHMDMETFDHEFFNAFDDKLFAKP